MRRVLVCLTLAAGLMVSSGMGAHAAPPPPGNGECPTGFERASVAEIDLMYGGLPGSVDAVGNQNGFVCRRAVGDGVFHTFPDRVDIVYLFADDTFKN
jgi:hypothetical protein